MLVCSCCFSPPLQKCSYLFQPSQRGEKIIRYEDEKKKELTKDDIKCPEGWEWKEDSQWQVDKRRVTDKDGTLAS